MSCTIWELYHLHVWWCGQLSVQKVEKMLASLNYIRSLRFTTDVSYFQFLNRIHDVELSLSSQGLWDVPHPWLNLFIPRSSISVFDSQVFKQLISQDFSGPILIYPVNQDKYVYSISCRSYVHQLILVFSKIVQMWFLVLQPWICSLCFDNNRRTSLQMGQACLCSHPRGKGVLPCCFASECSPFIWAWPQKSDGWQL